MKKIIYLLIFACVFLFACSPKTYPKTESPVVPTEATVVPTEPTVVPTEPTVVPTEPTVVPTEPTVIPTEPTIVTPVNSYTITFDCNDLTIINSITFEENDFPNLPTCNIFGYNFLGWYENETLVTTIDENRNYNLIAKLESTEVLPESIEISVSCDDEILYTDSVCYLSCKVLPEGASQDVTWRAMNKAKASLSDDLRIIVTAGNEATFKVTSNADEDISATITVKVRGYLNPYTFLDSIVVKSNEVVAKDIYAWGGSKYSTYLLGSVVNYLFEDLVVDSETYMIKDGAYNRPGKTAEAGNFELRYITVHDTGGTGDAAGNARYGNNPEGRDVCWHYTVGNDGIYQLLPNDEIGWHAGDGTSDPIAFYDSGIIAPEGETKPAKTSINQSNGKIMLNGQESLVFAAKTSTGAIPTNSQVAYTGINNYIDLDKNSPTYRHYMISKTYWNETYKTLCSRGGNMSSIGIESTVNKGSNIFYTWEKLAKLIGSNLLIKGNLTPNEVVQHNTWSGKDCPQTMRTAGMWETFKKYVENEYIIAKQFYSFTIEFSCDSEYINSNGMIKKLPDTQTEVTFKIRFSSTKEELDIEKEYKVTLPSKSTVNYFK